MPLHTTSDIPFAAFFGYLHFGGVVEVQLPIPPAPSRFPFRRFGVSTFRLSPVGIRLGLIFP